MEEKLCSNHDCEQTNPQHLSNFYSQNKYSKTRGNYIYYQPECKVCTKKRSRKWAIKNPERDKENNRRGVKVYKSKNREALRLYAKERRESGKQLEWQRNNKDKAKISNQYRQMNKKHEITNEEWENCKQYFNHKCAYCDLKIEEHPIQYKGKTQLGDFHKEHVDHEGANNLSNCVPSCKVCNTKKHTYSLEEWFEINDVGFDIDKLNKVNKWLDNDYKLYIEDKINT